MALYEQCLLPRHRTMLAVIVVLPCVMLSSRHIFAADVFLGFVHTALCVCVCVSWASEEALHPSYNCYIMVIVVCQCRSSEGVLGDNCSLWPA
jgi:hypothetical protein